jgi:alpha-L-fucosidase
MKVNGESIYGTTASPFKKLPWGRCTKKVHTDAATLYLHVFDWPKDGKLVVPGLKNKAQKAYLLSDAEQKSLPVEADAAGISIAVPKAAPGKICSVVALEVTGDLKIEIPLLSQNADGSIILDATDAVCHGEEVKTEERGDKTNLGYWTNPEDCAEWKFKLTKPGKFTVTAEIAGPQDSQIQVDINSEKVESNQAAGTKKSVSQSASLQSDVSKTGDYDKFEKVTLGEISLSATGDATLTVRPVAKGWHPINLRSITLTPAK